MAGVGIFVLVLAGGAIVTGSSIFAAGCFLGKCDNEHAGYVYGGLLSAVILSSVGVPLIVIGSRKEPGSAQKVRDGVALGHATERGFVAAHRPLTSG
jgi:hypothetical protein